VIGRCVGDSVGGVEVVMEVGGGELVWCCGGWFVSIQVASSLFYNATSTVSPYSFFLYACKAPPFWGFPIKSLIYSSLAILIDNRYRSLHHAPIASHHDVDLLRIRGAYVYKCPPNHYTISHSPKNMIVIHGFNCGSDI
jgi:hypothetical protein